MKIETIRIENLRCIKDVTVNFDEYTCLVGGNGAGKSTILTALNLFFRLSSPAGINPGAISVEDYHSKDTSTPIRVTLTFHDLSEQATQDLSHYVRSGKLVVEIEVAWTNDGKPKVIQRGSRLGMTEFADWFKSESDGTLVAGLREQYAALRQGFTDLPNATTKPAMQTALNAYEATHQDKCVLIKSEAQFYGNNGGKLAPHVQWVYVPAVKDVTTEVVDAKDSAIARLLDRSVRRSLNIGTELEQIKREAVEKYSELLSEHKTELGNLTKSLTDRLIRWAHPDASLLVDWRTDDDSNVSVKNPAAQIWAKEHGFSGEIHRFGNGLQRCVVFALLEELAAGTAEEEPTLILGIEEPELYQHPPQIRHIAGVLQKLAADAGQVVLTTHNPLLITGKDFSNVRMVRKGAADAGVTVSSTTAEAVDAQIQASNPARPAAKRPTGSVARLHQELLPGLCEMFFAPVVVLVEGIEDHAYITSALDLYGHWANFRRLGCHIVPVNGKNHIIRTLAVLRELGVPTYVVFDTDSAAYGIPPQPNESGQVDEVAKSKHVQHKDDNLTILKLLGEVAPAGFVPSTLSRPAFTAWHADMTSEVKADFVLDDWRDAKNRVEGQYGSPGGMTKNMLFIAEHLGELNSMGYKSSKLDNLCSAIIRFATPAGPV